MRLDAQWEDVAHLGLMHMGVDVQWGMGHRGVFYATCGPISLVQYKYCIMCKLVAN